MHAKKCCQTIISVKYIVEINEKLFLFITYIQSVVTYVYQYQKLRCLAHRVYTKGRYRINLFDSMLAVNSF